MSDLVGNPEDRFSRIMAHMIKLAVDDIDRISQHFIIISLTLFSCTANTCFYCFLLTSTSTIFHLCDTMIVSLVFNNGDLLSFSRTEDVLSMSINTYSAYKIFRSFDTVCLN